MSVRKSSHGTIFLIVSSGSPRALIASSLRSTSKKPFCPMTRSLHPPMTAHGHRVRFAATWREEFFEVPYRNFARRPLRRKRTWRVDRHDDVDLKSNQLRGKPGKSIELLFRRTELEEKILAFNIPGFAQCFTQLRPKGLDICIAYEERTNSIDLRLLLRPRHERPRRRAAEQSDERATFHLRDHSITSSARASTLAGISMPSAFAVLRLITSSYLVGACTGRSAGFAPLRMRSTYPAARRT